MTNETVRLYSKDPRTIYHAADETHRDAFFKAALDIAKKTNTVFSVCWADTLVFVNPSMDFNRCTEVWLEDRKMAQKSREKTGENTHSAFCPDCRR